GSEEQTHVIDCSVMYLFSKAAAEAIIRDQPDAKFIVCLRDPVAFIRAYHQQLLYNLDEDVESLAQAWALRHRRRLGVSIPQHCRESCFLDYEAVASFGIQVEHLLNQCDASRVHFLILEEWTRNPEAAYR